MRGTAVYVGSHRVSCSEGNLLIFFGSIVSLGLDRRKATVSVIWLTLECVVIAGHEMKGAERGVGGQRKKKGRRIRTRSDQGVYAPGAQKEGMEEDQPCGRAQVGVQMSLI